MKKEIEKLKSQLKCSKKYEKASITVNPPSPSHDSSCESSINDNLDSDFSYSGKVVSHSSSDLESMTVDSGASSHMHPELDAVEELVPNKTSVHLADGLSILLTSKGRFDPGFSDSSIHDTLVIPSLQEPLLSVSKLADSGIVSVFNDKECVFYRSPVISGKVVGRAPRRGGLYHKSYVRPSCQPVHHCNVVKSDLLDWHRRFNHPNVQTLKCKLNLSGVSYSSLNLKECQECRVCIQGKMRRRNFHSC